MTNKQWRDLRNYLISIASGMDKNTTEYRNINRRIRWIWENRL